MVLVLLSAIMGRPSTSGKSPLELAVEKLAVLTPQNADSLQTQKDCESNFQTSASF